MTTFITVAICTHNRSNFLGECVSSVIPQLTEGTEVLIIDNASTDGTPELTQTLCASHASVRAIRESKLGLSHARNAALENSDADWVLYLDDDAVACQGWLGAYTKFLTNLPDASIAVVGGAVRPNFESEPPPWIEVQRFGMEQGDAAFAFGDKGGPWGGNIAYRRVAALEIGGFDPHLGRKGKFQGAHEESFLNTRLKSAGHQVWWLPGAPILHFVPNDRLRLRTLCRLAFDAGRSSAVVRLEQSPTNKYFLLLSRTSLLPFQLLAYFAISVPALLTGKRTRAVKNILGATRSIGYCFQLLKTD